MIPDVAVEAAAIAYQSVLAECGQPLWEDLPYVRRTTRLDWMRAALAAAAPHMLEAEYDRGFEDGHLSGYEEGEAK